MMNNRHKNFIFFILMLSFIFMSQSRDQYVPSYGGKIQFNNNSLHNLYIIFQTVDNKEIMLCIEKNEQIQIWHSSHNKISAHPANFYKSVSVYNLDTGVLLKSFHTETEMFILKSGKIDSNNALFEFVIDNELLESGI